MKQATHRILRDCHYFKEGEEVYLTLSNFEYPGAAYRGQSVNPSRGEGHWWMSHLSNVEELQYQLEND